MIVLDASAALELLLVTDKGRRVAERIAPPEETLDAPLLTSDARLGDVPDSRARIEIV